MKAATKEMFLFALQLTYPILEEHELKLEKLQGLTQYRVLVAGVNINNIENCKNLPNVFSSEQIVELTKHLMRSKLTELINEASKNIEEINKHLGIKNNVYNPINR